MTRFGIHAVTAILFLAVTGCSAPDSTERRGNFQIEYFRTGAFGHIATRRALHHLNSLTANEGHEISAGTTR